MRITKVRSIKQFYILFLLSIVLSNECISDHAKKNGVNLFKVSRSIRKAVKRLWELSYLRDLEIESSKPTIKIKARCKKLRRLVDYVVQYKKEEDAKNILCGLALQRMFEDLE